MVLKVIYWHALLVIIHNNRFHYMMSGFNLQLDTTWIHLGRESQWGIVRTKLIDVGRPNPLWVAPFPRQGILECVRVEKSIRTNKQAFIYLFSLYSWLSCDWLSCVSILISLHRGMVTGVYKPNKCLRYVAFFLGCFVIATDIKLVHIMTFSSMQ